MSIADKLIKITENEAQTTELNQKLEDCLYGADVGGKSWYDEFWDSYNTSNQTYSRSDFMFAGRMWNDVTFKPKHDIVLKPSSSGVFYDNGCTNLKAILNECGVKLDTSQVTNVGNFFISSSIEVLPEIDFSNATTVTNAFGHMSYLKSIDKVTFKNGVTFNTTFNNLKMLEEIRIGGTISGSGFDIHWSTKLTADSLKSIIQALSTTTTGLTITLPTTAQANYEAVYGAGSWETLTASRNNWTIAYA